MLYRGQCLEGMRTPELLMLKEVHEEALMHVSKELLMRECETEVASEHPEYVCPLSANAQGNCDVKGGGKGKGWKAPGGASSCFFIEMINKLA